MESILAIFSTENINSFIMAFCRIGPAFYFLPGFSEQHILRRIRINLAALFSIILISFIPIPEYTAIGPQIKDMLLEMVIGLLIGSIAKIYALTMDTVGSMIAMQSGLSSAAFFDPNQKGQISVFSIFLNLLLTVVIFVSDTHHYFLKALMESYDKLPIGTIMTGDMAKTISFVISNSFILAFKIAFPFIITSYSIQIANGILSRLIPNIQIIFVLMPAQILISFAILYSTVQVIAIKVIDVLQELHLINIV